MTLENPHTHHPALTDAPAILLEQFNRLTPLPNGIQRLRELILQLAVQGKLVPQNPNDEPASELLKRIEAEKAQLIAEGKLKKQKPLPPIADNEKPFDLPLGWSFSRLGQILHITRGITFPGSEKKKTKGDNDIACLRTASIQNEIDWNDLIYVDKKFVKNEHQYVQIGDIMISMANSYERVGKVAIIKENMQESTFGGFISAIRAYELNIEYLYYLLSSPAIQSAFRKSSSQTVNIANISLAGIYPILTGLPPLAEQQRIVEKVDSLMALCDELEAQQATMAEQRQQFVASSLHHLTTAPNGSQRLATWQPLASTFTQAMVTPQAVKDLRNTILQLAVQGKLVPQDPNDEPASELLKRIETVKAQLVAEGKLKKQKPLPPITDDEKPFDLPQGWEWVRLNHAYTYNGATQTKPEELNANSWLLELEDIEKVSSKIIQKKIVSDRAVSSNKSYFQSNCVLYGKLRPYLKKCVVPKTEGYCTTEIVSILPHSANSPEYLRIYLLSPEWNKYIDSKMYGMKMPRLGTRDAEEGLVSLPPIGEQQRIVDKVDALMALCDELDDAIATNQNHGQALLASLTHHITGGA